MSQNQDSVTFPWFRLWLWLLLAIFIAVCLLVLLKSFNGPSATTASVPLTRAVSRPAATVTATATEDHVQKQVAEVAKVAVGEAVASSERTAAVQLTLGPFVSQRALEQALEKLAQLGYKAQQQSQQSELTMTRLLLGHYPRKTAQQKLKQVETWTDGAFLVAEGERFAVYAGSFSECREAQHMQQLLSGHALDSKAVEKRLPLPGSLLLVNVAADKVDKAQAEFDKAGLTTLPGCDKLAH